MSLQDVLDQAIEKAVNNKPVEPKQEPKAEKPEPKIEAKPEPKKEVEHEPVVEEVDEELEEKALSFKDAIKEVKKEIKEQPRIERIIEDGVEREISLDELKKGYQKGSVSGKRFDEAAKALKDAKSIEQQVQDFVEFMDLNPIAGMYEVLGEERTNQVLEQYRREMHEYEQMSPEARENFLLKRRLEARDTGTKFKVEREQEVLSNEQAQSIKIDLSSKVEKVVEEYGLGSNEMRLRLLNKMKAVGQYKGPNHYFDMTEIEILAEQVKEETRGELTGMVKNMKGQELLKSLGNDVVEEVRKELLNQYKMQRGEKMAVSEKDQPKKVARKFESLEDARKFWEDPTTY